MTARDSHPEPSSPARPRSVTFAEAARFWLKLGFISFGGPAGQIAIMHRELVEQRRWLSESRFLHALNYCMLLPGPEAQQLATYVGWLLHGVRGGLVAGGLFVLPSIFVLLGLSYAYAAHGDTSWAAGILYGFRPVVVAIICEAVLRIGKRAIRRRLDLLIAAAAFAAIYLLGIPFPLIVVGAAAVGWAGSRGRADEDQPPATVAADRQDDDDGPELVIDDDSPPPPHTLPSLPGLVRTLSIGIGLWVAGLVALGAFRGFASLHSQQYVFFTKAAFVTFGGAYAVLAYVAQASVETLGWLSSAQVVDGLALAETTPGPLIMVVQFVGFMAAWNHPEGLPLLTSATLGALVTTFVTFLPCFLFIFVGAPYIEVLRSNRTLAATLSGVTAAVVGVILNLALVFGEAVLLLDGAGGRLDWLALGLAAAAFLALWRLRAEVLWLIVAGGAVGLLAATWINP